MSPGTKEINFEEYIEDDLVSKRGWLKGNNDDYDRELGLFPKDVISFIQESQPGTWAELTKSHKNLETTLIERLCKVLDNNGTLDVLRHGFKFYGKNIDLAYFKPAHGLNEEILQRYEQNRCVVTRQVYLVLEKKDSVDMVLSVNGLPVATIELKNHLTGQTVDDAKKQYKRRDPRIKLYQFKKRALVHFAVDDELAAMTTRLAGPDTHFLPFNRGFEGGAGNPEHSCGYRTGYLWEEVWERESFLDILARFVHLQEKEEVDPDGKRRKTEQIIFPRYHQLDAVRKLVATSQLEGPGHNYLVQHSAGSGKSNSIAWLAHRLASLHNDQDEKIFDSVVVVTDRRVLDKQLQDTIYQFEHKGGVVERITKHSSQLADALKKGAPIIITTLQKFPFAAEKMSEQLDRKFAVIVDEAHSSQSGEAAREMKAVLGAKPEEALEKAAAAEGGEEPTYEDEIARVLRSRGKQANLSFFAFTATPKAKTLEVFGRETPDGPAPFHLYSMRQAIEENFILDVLQNYTTYQTYYRLVKAAEEDPEVNKRTATRALARFVSLHPHNIAQKTEVMIEHFRGSVRHKIGGKAKAMVVTSSRLHAVKYKQSFDKYLKEHSYDDIKTLVAFSGTVVDENDFKYTEPGMNLDSKSAEPISMSALADKFATPEYQVLLVANKYQTGFDQPLLHTMYLDKRISGVQAVQCLSRLNRTYPGKTDTFVLDFTNDADAIREAFQPYYETTTVSETADPHQLYDLQDKLDRTQVYLESEVEAFAKIFYKPRAQNSKKDLGHLYSHLDPAVDRFNAREEAEQEEFRNTLKGFVRLYGFLSQIMPFTDEDLEKRYSFGRSLLLRLPKRDSDGAVQVDSDVALNYYRLDKTFEGEIGLAVHEGGVVYGPNAVGTREIRDEMTPLSAIIEILNERFGTDFEPQDQLSIDQFVEDAKANEDIQQKAQANEFENFAGGWLKKALMDIVIDRMDKNEKLTTRYLNDEEFQDVLFKLMAERVYEDLKAK